MNRMMVANRTGKAAGEGLSRQRAATTPRSSVRSTKTRTVARSVVGVVILAVIIEIVSRAGIVNEQFLPPFSTVVVRAATLFGDPAFLGALLATIASFVLGLLIAAVMGVGLGVLFGLSQTVYFATRGVVEIIRPMPPVAMIPLVILILGNGLSMKLVVVVFACIWPILFNTMYGVHAVDPAQSEMARSFGTSRAAVIGRVVLPAAAPSIATGIRLASSIAMIIVITVELIAGGSTGLGSFIASARASGTGVVNVYAGILIAGFLGLLVNLVMASLERRWFGWNARTGVE